MGRGGVAQVVERSPPMPKVRGSNPDRCRCGFCVPLYRLVPRPSQGTLNSGCSLCTHAFKIMHGLKRSWCSLRKRICECRLHAHMYQACTFLKTECGYLRVENRKQSHTHNLQGTRRTKERKKERKKDCEWASRAGVKFLVKQYNQFKCIATPHPNAEISWYLLLSGTQLLLYKTPFGSRCNLEKRLLTLWIHRQFGTSWRNETPFSFGIFLIFEKIKHLGRRISRMWKCLERK